MHYIIIFSEYYDAAGDYQIQARGDFIHSAKIPRYFGTKEEAEQAIARLEFNGKHYRAVQAIPELIEAYSKTSQQRWEEADEVDRLFEVARRTVQSEGVLGLLYRQHLHAWRINFIDKQGEVAHYEAEGKGENAVYFPYEQAVKFLQSVITEGGVK